MRERAEKATSGPWEFRPRRGFQSMSDSPATIGFTDAAGYFVMFREGAWMTESDAEYVASWHPAVALAVADWLDMCAADLTGIPGQNITPSPYEAQAITVARAYLGDDA
jgi:hypothetical protein